MGLARSGTAGQHGGMDREDLRLAVYRSFAESGRAPTPAELASRCGTDVPAVRRGPKELAASRDLVLDGQGRIVMAHPFSAIPLGFRSWAPECCGGAAAPGTRSRSPICCPERVRCWWPHGARRAGARTPGTSEPVGRPSAATWRISWCLRPGCGTT